MLAMVNLSFWGCSFAGSIVGLIININYLLFFEISDHLILNNINVVDFELVLYFLLALDFGPEYLRQVQDAFIFDIVGVLVVWL